MIDVQNVLDDIPHFDRYVSIEQMRLLVEELATLDEFDVRLLGESTEGRPIHHIRYGEGATKAFFLGFPHCSEPICGLTVYSLLTLLKNGHPGLTASGVEWHIVPYLDPDGSVQNEDWNQKPFTLPDYMRGFHMQEPSAQPDISFPMSYKKFAFDKPTVEAKILAGLLDEVRPDFFFTLHNALVAGSFFMASKDLGERRSAELRQLMQDLNVTVDEDSMHKVWHGEFSPGIISAPSYKKLYDFFEASLDDPSVMFNSGCTSMEYALEHGTALAFVSEIAHAEHRDGKNDEPAGESMRHMILRIDAENKFLAAQIAEEWKLVEGDLDRTSAFYRKIYASVIEPFAHLIDGLPYIFAYKISDILSNPIYSKIATRAQKVQTFIYYRYWTLCHLHEFVRLLQASPQTEAITGSLARIVPIYEAGIEEVDREIGMDGVRVIDLDVQAKAQLGSGLIALNALLDQRHAASTLAA